MASRNPRDPWRAIWQIVTSDGVLAGLCLVVGVALATTAWLPQMSPATPAAYARQLSEAQARFGEATRLMERLGLFTVVRSYGFRAVQALLAGCLLLRLYESIDRLRQGRDVVESAGEWREIEGVQLPAMVGNLHRRRYRVLSEASLFQVDRWPWADLFPAIAYTGALFLLAGLLVTHLWGWQLEGVIVQSQEPAKLLGSEKWVALNADGQEVTHSPGILTFVEERGPGALVSATDDTGRTLSLQQTLESAPVTQLRVALARDPYLATREVHIAIPEAQLILRLLPQPGLDIDSGGPILVQIYRSPSGELATEAVVSGESELAVGDVSLKLISASYVQLTVSFSPGLWPTAAGVLLLVVGLMGGIVWPVRRFWLRNEAGAVEGTGDLSAALAGGKGG